MKMTCLPLLGLAALSIVACGEEAPTPVHTTNDAIVASNYDWSHVASYQTQHPYENNAEHILTFVAKNPRATAMRVRFERFELENQRDYLTIWPGGNLPYGTPRTGNQTGKVLTFETNQLRLVFESDGAGTRWGFRVRIEQGVRKTTGCLCTQEYQPVCGEDGSTYYNRCAARCANTPVLGDGPCVHLFTLGLNPNRDIPDNDSRGVVSRMRFKRAGETVSTLRVSVDIEHTWIGDLRVILISPSGKRHRLHNRSGGSADNLRFTNRVITAFDGEPINGNWRLKVLDLAARDVGRIKSWSLVIDP